MPVATEPRVGEPPLKTASHGAFRDSLVADLRRHVEALALGVPIDEAAAHAVTAGLTIPDLQFACARMSEVAALLVPCHQAAEAARRLRSSTINALRDRQAPAHIERAKP
jgi:hypothetical protein